MKKILIGVLAIILTSSSLFAQYATINFEADINQLNGDEPLPAEKNIYLTGATFSDIQLVEVAILTAKGKDSRKPLYSNSWRRPHTQKGTQYKVKLNYKLNAGKEYDFLISFYKQLTLEDQKALYEQLSNNLDNYVSQNIDTKKKTFQLSKKTKHMISDLNDIVQTGLSEYRTTNQFSFGGFSDLIRGQLEKIEDTKVKEKKNTNEVSTKKQMIEHLKKMLRSELQFVLNNEWNTLHRSYYVDNIETEKRNGYFAINAGYGAVFLGGDIDNLNYGAAPYVGLSFPLSTSTIAPKFFRNASITMGIFTKNFENESGETITGPIVKKPIYLGLDYKLFQFIRFNAGASFLEEAGEDNGQISGIEKRVFIKPFVGLSAKINLSISLDK